MLKTKGISKEYKDKTALKDVSLIFPTKGLVIIKGESGSGKSTLLNLLTANDFPSSGKIEYCGREITAKNSEEFRRRYCSNIYQDYMLLEDMSVRENVELAMQASGQEYDGDDVIGLLEQVGIEAAYADKKTSKLSGGEKQRVAIARAISKKGAMIFADEPTGNLDSKNGDMVMRLLKEISKERLVVVVSHNEKQNEKYGDYTIELMDGEVVNSDLTVEEEERGEEKENEEKGKRRGRLRAKTLMRLAFWGFEKNKVKTVISIIAFVAVCILSMVSMTAYIGDINLALTKSIAKCERKNVMFDLIQSVFFRGDKGSDRRLEDFVEKCDYDYSYVMPFNLRADSYELKESYHKSARRKHLITQAVIYNPEIGADVDIVSGRFPKKPNEIMFPLGYAQIMAEYFVDYLADDVSELVGKTFAYYTARPFDDTEKRTKLKYEFKICGIFDGGIGISDGDYTKLNDMEQNYISETDFMQKCVFLGYGAEYILHSNFVIFPDNLRQQNRYGVFDDISSQGKVWCGYDEYALYAKTLPALGKGEIYVGSGIASYLGYSVGDKLDFHAGYYRTNDNGEDEFTETATLREVRVKGIVDIPVYGYEIIFSREDFEDVVLEPDFHLCDVTALYFNVRTVKDKYAFFNNVCNAGQSVWSSEEGGYPTLNKYSASYYAAIHNTKATSVFYGTVLQQYRYFLILPLMGLSFIGMLAIGYVSMSYLISSKEKSYNVLRSLGFGRGNIAAILCVQIAILLTIEIMAATLASYLMCAMLSDVFVPRLAYVATQLDPEVLLPLGYASPLAVSCLMLVTGATVILIKVFTVFSKSITETKTK